MSARALSAYHLKMSACVLSSPNARAFRSRAQYEMYFVSPIPGAAVTGNLQVTVTAQLGDSAVAGEWKVDLYNRATDVFDPIGVDNTLTGGKHSWIWLQFIFVSYLMCGILGSFVVVGKYCSVAR